MAPLDTSGFDGIYLITDRTLAIKGIIAEIIEALEGGIRFIQLREKDLGGKDLLSLAREIRELTFEFGAKLIINGRIDIAALSAADGVHLGHLSVSPTEARRLVGAERLIGVSTHNIEEAKKAQTEGADFITFGPVFHTPSKAPFGEPVGTDKLREVKKAVSIPVYALGGIKKKNIKEVVSAGADGISVISAIIGTDDVKGSAESLIEELRRARA